MKENTLDAPFSFRYSAKEHIVEPVLIISSIIIISLPSIESPM